MERRTLIKGAALGAVAPVIGATGAAARTTGRAGLGTTNGKSIISTEHAITAEPFGTLPDGSPVERWTLTNRRGARVRILSYGGIVQSLEVPDRHGALGNVALGYPDFHVDVTPPRLENDEEGVSAEYHLVSRAVRGRQS